MYLFTINAKSWNQHLLEAHAEYEIGQYLYRRVKLLEGLKFYIMHMVTVFSKQKIRTRD